MKRRDWLILVGFLALTFVLRFSAFFRTVVDWDETVFLMMGRDMLRGYAPYTTVYEHSPIGGTLLFALAQLLFGQTVLAIRILTWLAVALESFLLYRLGNLLAPRAWAPGLIAGLLYAVFSLNNYGLGAHRELFFAPCITLAIYLLLSIPAPQPGVSVRRSSGPTLKLLVAGFLLGFGLQIKFLYIFDVVAVCLVFALKLIADGPRDLPALARRALRSYALLAIGPIVWFGLVTAAFLWSGHFDLYLQANFQAASTYARSESFSFTLTRRALILQVRANFLLWLSLFLTPLYVILERDLTREERRNFGYLWIWFVFAFAGTIFTGRLWNHYFLQLLPPLCLLAGLLIGNVLRPSTGLSRVSRALAATLILLVAAGPLTNPVVRAVLPLMTDIASQDRSFLKDAPTVVADYLRQRITPGEMIYVVDYEPVLYYLLDTPAPTRYVFPPHLIRQDFQEIDRIDALAELDSIMRQRPRYVVRSHLPDENFTSTAYLAALEQRLQEDYTLEAFLPVTDSFGGSPIAVDLYRLKS